MISLSLLAIRLSRVALVVALAPAIAHAQPASLAVAAPPGTIATTYPEYRERVLAESPAVAEAHATALMAEAAIDIARVPASPRLSGGLTSVDVSGHDAPNATHLILSVPLDYAGQIGPRVESRIAAHDASVALVEATRRDLLRSAAVRFIDALEATLVRIDAIEAVEAEAALVSAMERRLSAGEATALDVRLARIAAAAGIARLRDAEGQERTTRIALSALLGGVDGALAPVGDLAVAPRTFDVEALVAEALANRPEVRAAQMLEVARGHERELASAERWPALDAQVGWLHSFASLSPSIFNQPEYDALALGATIEVPIRLAWDGDLRAADSQIDHARAELRAQELAVSIEVREALVEYESARDQLAVREAALTDADALRRAAADALSRGASTILEQLAANAEVREAISAYVAAAASHARTLAILLARVGRAEAPL